MKRLLFILMLSFTLSACAVLLVGCGGSGQDTSQKGTTVINQPQQEADCND